MKQKAQPIHEATRMDKRVETMPDGRYMIFYTYPDIEKDMERLERMAEDRPHGSWPSPPTSRNT